MAKDKAGEKSRKTKIRIPKEIAGVKIPKSLRDSGKAAIRMAQDPSTRAMVSAGLMAAASMMAARKQAQRNTASGEATSMGEAAESAANTAQQIGVALIGAAETAAQRFFGLVDVPAAPGTASGGGDQSEQNAPVVDEASRAAESETAAVAPVAAALKKVSVKGSTTKAVPADGVTANGIG